MVVPVELARQLVALHRLALARLLGEIGVAFDASLARWFRVFPDPMQILSLIHISEPTRPAA